MINLVELFCHVDDFCQRFMPVYQKTLLEQQVKHHKNHECSLSTSEMMTIILYFYHLGRCSTPQIIVISSIII
jgi:hypothetical protein